MVVLKYLKFSKSITRGPKENVGGDILGDLLNFYQDAFLTFLTHGQRNLAIARVQFRALFVLLMICLLRIMLRLPTTD